MTREERKVEIVRIITQALEDLGYQLSCYYLLELDLLLNHHTSHLNTWFISDSASLLQRESGYAYEAASISKFRSALLSGSWEMAESLLASIEVIPGSSNVLLHALLFFFFMILN